jgi:hypothetical protein
MAIPVGRRHPPARSPPAEPRIGVPTHGPDPLGDGGPSFIIHHIGLEQGLPSFIIHHSSWLGNGLGIQLLSATGNFFPLRLNFSVLIREIIPMGIIPTGGTGIHHHHHHHHHLYHGAGLDGACRRGLRASAPGLAGLIITPSFIITSSSYRGNGAGLLGSCDLGGDRAA